jgi:hypothetical protein
MQAFMAWWFCHLCPPRQVEKWPNLLTSLWSPCMLSKCQWNNHLAILLLMHASNVHTHLDPSCTQSTFFITCFGGIFSWSPSWKVISTFTKIVSLLNRCEYCPKKSNIHLYTMKVLQLDQQVNGKQYEGIMIKPTSGL